MPITAAEIAKRLGKAAKSGDGWKCQCPTHDDRNPSLSVRDAENGRVLVHCHAGCHANDVIGALKSRGLWPSASTGHRAAAKGRNVEEGDFAPVMPVPADAPKPDFRGSRLGDPAAVYEYKDGNGDLLGYICRYEAPGGKEFRPFTCHRKQDGQYVWRRKAFPKPLPLYGLDHLAEHVDEPVLIVEGEKAADAARILFPNLVVITWPGGTGNASYIDLMPFKGRNISIWPDADPGGRKAANTIAELCEGLRAESVRVITPPADRNIKGWDAADALDEGMSEADLARLIETARIWRPSVEEQRTGPISIRAWDGRRYKGPPPERRWLIPGIFPAAVPVMLAAQGGVGKSMLTLLLALEIAGGNCTECDRAPRPIIGGPVVRFGTVIILTAEDDDEEVHRRLHTLDTNGVLDRHPERLIVLPLPSLMGSLPVVEEKNGQFVVSDAWNELEQQVWEIDDLVLVVFDPLQAFVQADVNKDPAAGQFLCAFLGRLAKATGATVMVTHHFNKPARNAPIENAAAARLAIRGTTAIVDGVRMAYALWPAIHAYARDVCRAIGIKYAPNTIVRGAVVKENFKADPDTHTFVRNSDGLLEDLTHRIGTGGENWTLLAEQLIATIAYAASKGHPFTKTGGPGLYLRREELPNVLRKLSRNKIEWLCQEQLDAKRILKCAAKGQNNPKWLDVPDGLFAKGEGKFAPGASKGFGPFHS